MRGQARRSRRLNPPPERRAKALAPEVHVPRLQIPDTDWSAVCAGSKRQLRCYRPGRDDDRDEPEPCIFWSPAPFHDTVRAVLGVVEWRRREPLGAISAESLRQEGFDTLAEFRTYFIGRHPQRAFRPLDSVMAYAIRPWQDGDEVLAKDWLLARALPWAFGEDDDG